MMKSLRNAFYAGVLAVGLVGGTAAAGGLVNVNLGPVLIQDIANDLNVNVSNIPVTVQVPVGIAANVCDVNANILAAQNRAGGATCDAKNNSSALTQIIQNQMNAQ